MLQIRPVWTYILVLKTMKTTIWTYPWDALAAGPETTAREIAETGLGAISLAATYHSFDQLRPHGHGNTLLTVDQSAAYYPFSPEAFRGGPTPAPSPLLTGADWANCAVAAKEAGLDVIAWTIFLHNSYLASTHPELAQITCSGDTLRHQLCPAQPRVREFACTLAADICRLDEVDVLECESISYGGFGHAHFHPKVGVELGLGGRYLFSLCFCDACVSGSRDDGVDINALRDRTSEKIKTVFTTGSPIVTTPEEMIASDPDLAAFQRFRDATVTDLIQGVVDAAGKPVRLLAMGDRLTSALDIRSTARCVDAIEYLCYSPDPDRIRQIIGDAITDVGSPSKLGIGLQAYPPASRNAADLTASVSITAESGAGLASFYNYGIMPKQSLSWIRASLRA
jgi:hypothetical protein